MARKKKAGRRNPELLRLILNQNGKCFYCFDKMELKRRKRGGISNPLAATVDHVMPLVHGGVNGRRNRVAACFQCNNDKGGRLPSFEESTRLRALVAGCFVASI